MIQHLTGSAALWGLTLAVFIGCNSLKCDASEFDCMQQMEPSMNGSATNIGIKEEESPYFDENMDYLNRGYVQMSVLRLSKNEFMDDYSEFNWRGAAEKVDEDSFVVITKLAYLFRGVTPAFFNLSNTSSQGFVNANYHDTINRVVIRKQYPTVESETNYLFKKVSTKVHLRDFDFANEQSFGLSQAEAYRLKRLAPKIDGLAYLGSNHYDESDVSDGSYGGGTLNFYYAQGEDTLMVSLRMMTIKREPYLKGWGKSYLWNKVLQSIDANISESNIKSLLNINRYIKENTPHFKGCHEEISEEGE